MYFARSGHAKGERHRTNRRSMMRVLIALDHALISFRTEQSLFRFRFVLFRLSSFVLSCFVFHSFQLSVFGCCFLWCVQISYLARTSILPIRPGCY